MGVRVSYSNNAGVSGLMTAWLLLLLLQRHCPSLNGSHMSNRDVTVANQYRT